MVLYEMLTGERLFAGETVSDVLAAVLTRDPQIDHVPPEPWTGTILDARTEWFRFALHPDGRRVAGTITTASDREKSTEPEIVLVTNFFDELKATFARR